ncbi:MAG: N-acetylneuraminate synthase family protein [Nitrosarchaeum sp.]
MKLKIDGKFFDLSKNVFVIAEAGVNHNNNLSIAYRMIDKAKNAGADAIKFQTFITKEIQLHNSIKPNYQKNIHSSYFDIIKSLEPTFSDQIKLSKYCKKKNIIFLSTPYDEQSVDFLSSIHIPLFKIASTDLTNSFLLKYICKKHKPIFLSTGLSTFNEIDQSIKLLNQFHMKNKLVLFHTTSSYPTPNEEVNLNIIPEYIKRYKVTVGFSDHTQNEIASLGAISLGARVLEKHFTLDRTMPGPDQSSSLEPSELKEWIKKIRLMEKSLGSNIKKITKSESKNLTMRKVIAIKPTLKSTKITLEHITAMRGKKSGILPLDSNIKKILGKKLVRNIKTTMEFSWNMIK